MTKEVLNLLKVIGLSILILIMLSLNRNMKPTMFTDILVYGVVSVSLIIINIEYWRHSFRKKKKQDNQEME